MFLYLLEWSLSINDSSRIWVIRFENADSPETTKCSANVGTMLAHRLRLWPSIVPTLAEGLVFAGSELDVDGSVIYRIVL